MNHKAVIGETIRILTADPELSIGAGELFPVSEVDEIGGVRVPYGIVYPHNYSVITPDGGWKFSVHTETGELVFEKVYEDEHMEDAFAAWIDDVGGLELGTQLKIVEVVESEPVKAPCMDCGCPGVVDGFCADHLPF